MKKDFRRQRLHLKQKTATRIKAVYLAGFFSISVLAAIIFIFQITVTRNLKAAGKKEIEIKQIPEQEFSNEIFIPKPFINKTEPSGKNSLCLRKIKEAPVQPAY